MQLSIEYLQYKLLASYVYFHSLDLDAINLLYEKKCEFTQTNGVFCDD